MHPSMHMTLGHFKLGDPLLMDGHEVGGSSIAKLALRQG